MKKLSSDPAMDLKHEFHPGGRKRLQDAVNDFQLTMQHAVRSSAVADLVARAQDQAIGLPPFSVLEMYDYLFDTDPEFLNWMFPYCAVKLTRSNIGYLHSYILTDFRTNLLKDAQQ